MNYDATLFGRSGHCRSGFVRYTIENGDMFQFHVGILTVIYALTLYGRILL
jgi:hypothetical protein